MPAEEVFSLKDEDVGQAIIAMLVGAQAAMVLRGSTRGGTKKRTVTLGLSVATIGASLGLNNAKRGEVICGTAGLAALGGAAGALISLALLVPKHLRITWRK